MAKALRRVAMAIENELVVGVAVVFIDKDGEVYSECCGTSSDSLALIGALEHCKLGVQQVVTKGNIEELVDFDD